MVGGECFDLQVKKRTLSMSSTDNERDRRGDEDAHVHGDIRWSSSPLSSSASNLG